MLADTCDFAEQTCHGLCELGHADLLVGFGAEAGHLYAIDAAGGDGEKAGEAFPRHIESKTVHGDPLFHADTDGGHFAIINPHAGQSFSTLGFHAPMSTTGDKNVFDHAQMHMQILPARSQVENGIANQLPWSVLGCLATTVRLHNRMRQPCRIAQRRLITQSTDRIDRLVL